MPLDTRFHCVYLLTSGDVRCVDEYYIGYTTHPLRRLRQHNGALLHGAARTSRRGRPWLLVCCVSGFVEDRAALRFEWCWQHPEASARLKHSAAPTRLRRLRRTLPFAVGVLHALLRARLFARLALTLHIFDTTRFAAAAATARAHVQQQQQQPQRPLSVHGNDDNNDDDDDDDDAVMPALVPSDLLHIEHTTPDAFEATYLSHDRSLRAHEHNDDDDDDDDTEQHKTRTAASRSVSPVVPLRCRCPYDVSSLSQSVLDEYSRDSKRDASTCSSDVDDDDNDDNDDATTPAWRVPHRFRYYRAADYARVHVREQQLLCRGLLPCTLCALPLRAPYLLRCPREPHCYLRTHIACLAMWFHYHAAQQQQQQQQQQQPRSVADDVDAAMTLVPSGVSCACPLCGVALQWCALVRTLKHRARLDRQLTLQRRRWLLERRWQRRLAALTQPRRARAAATTTTAAAVMRQRCRRRRLSQRLADATTPTAETMPVTTTTTAGVSRRPCAVRAATQPRCAHATHDDVSSSNNNNGDDGDATVLLGWTPFDEQEWLLPR